jgi:putative membrane protein
METDYVGGGHMGWGGLADGFFMIFLLLLWAALIALIVWLLLRFVSPVRGRGAAPPDDPAEEILRRRFAAGEIDADEYERRLAVLRAKR